MGPAATIWLRLVRRFTPLVIFAIGFGILLLVILHYYMAPAMRAAEHASPRERRLLAVQSRLLLVVVLFVLFALLALTFRIGRGMNRSCPFAETDDLSGCVGGSCAANRASFRRPSRVAGHNSNLASGGGWSLAIGGGLANQPAYRHEQPLEPAEKSYAGVELEQRDIVRIDLQAASNPGGRAFVPALPVERQGKIEQYRRVLGVQFQRSPCRDDSLVIPAGEELRER